MTFKELYSLNEYQNKIRSVDNDFINMMYYLIVVHREPMEETILYDIIKEHITQ